MKKFALLSLFLLAGCGAATPDAGHEAILVKKPMFFGHGGCAKEPIKTGRAWIALTTEAIIVDMRPRQQEVTFDDLFTLDGVPLDFQSAIQYRVTDSAKLVCEFGADDGPQGMGFFKRVLEQPFRSAVRDAVKRRGLNEMAINVSAADAVDGEVTEAFKLTIKATGVPIELINVTLGRANPPDAIKHQRIATAEQEQRVNTEKQRKLAEDMRKEAENSRAVADRAYNDRMGLDTDKYLALEQIKAFREVCKGGNCTFVSDKVSALVNIK